MKFLSTSKFFFFSLVVSVFLTVGCDSRVEKIDIVSGGETRSYELFIPSGYDGSSIPLVLDLHGKPSTGWQQADVISKMRDVGEENGFAVVHPNGKSMTWNVYGEPGKPDDILFLSDVINDISGKIAVDSGSIFITGYSVGGQMASLAACSIDSIAAVAPVAGIRYFDACTDRAPVSIAAFHGTADTSYPYEGDTEDDWGEGVEDAINKWVAHNSCSSDPAIEYISDLVTKFTYSRCDANTEVVLFKITDGGHTWPGTSAKIPFIGEVNKDISASAAAWDFFDLHRDL
ncbi:MAG: hypothetical protein GY754_30140 [bacterium]|nr:hypothetical protein [bacterium]